LENFPVTPSDRDFLLIPLKIRGIKGVMNVSQPPQNDIVKRSQHALLTASKVANKGYLIAVGKLGTAIAFRPYLLGQLRFVD